MLELFPWILLRIFWKEFTKTAIVSSSAMKILQRIGLPSFFFFLTLIRYHGNQKSMLITNTLFRVGGAAVLLSNKSGWKNTAKYQLVTTVRVHKGADDICYGTIYQMQDSVGEKGFSFFSRYLTL